MLKCCAKQNVQDPKPIVTEAPAPEAPAPPAPPAPKVDPVPSSTAEPTAEAMAKKIFIVYYSTYGHILTVAKKIKEGVDSVDGCEGVLYQVAETLPEEVLTKMGAPPKPEDIPVLDPKDLADADGILIGMPSRFGSQPAQVKAMWDATGGLWQSGALVGKPAGTFFSTGTLGGGQETVALTTIPQFVHHGMIYVPLGYQNPKMFSLDEVHGGSPYGCGTLAGADGSRMPSDLELEIAETQGKYFAGKTLLLCA